MSSSTHEIPPRFKVMLVGDGGSGKTSYVNRLLPGRPFEPRYIPTLGAELTPMGVTTNYGTYVFNIWETAGQEKYGGKAESYYKNVDGILVFFDVSSNLGHKNAKQWESNVKAISPNIPSVWVGAKCDMSRKINPDPSAFVDISAKTRNDLYKPLVVLARKMTGFPDLEIIDIN